MLRDEDFNYWMFEEEMSGGVTRASIILDVVGSRGYTYDNILYMMEDCWSHGALAWKEQGWS